MSRYQVSIWGCAGSVTGHGRTDVYGRCPWCSRQVDAPTPRPNLSGWRSEDDVEYRRFYDPDFGLDPKDY